MKYTAQIEFILKELTTTTIYSFNEIKKVFDKVESVDITIKICNLCALNGISLLTYFEETAPSPRNVGRYRYLINIAKDNNGLLKKLRKEVCKIAGISKNELKKALKNNTISITYSRSDVLSDYLIGAKLKINGNETYISRSQSDIINKWNSLRIEIEGNK